MLLENFSRDVLVFGILPYISPVPSLFNVEAKGISLWEPPMFCKREHMWDPPSIPEEPYRQVIDSTFSNWYKCRRVYRRCPSLAQVSPGIWEPITVKVGRWFQVELKSPQDESRLYQMYVGDYLSMCIHVLGEKHYMTRSACGEWGYFAEVTTPQQFYKLNKAKFSVWLHAGSKKQQIC